MKRLFFLTAVVALCSAMAPALAGVVYVKQDSPGPVFDGKSWDTAFRKVQEGIDAAIPGDQVWVAGGTYVERLTMKSGVALFGGFPSAGGSLSDRDAKANVTTVDGDALGTVITIGANATSNTIIDGFSIINGGPSCGATGISCDTNCSPVISNNAISGNARAILGVSGGSPVITNNLVTGNASAGLLWYSGTPLVANNVVTNNGYGGISIRYATARIVNNTVVENSGQSYGIQADGSVIVANNIVAYNTIGIIVQGSGSMISHNCVFGSTTADYASPDQTGTNGNIKVDPMLAYGRVDVHIQPASPCRDAGDNTLVQQGWADMDGQARIQPADGTVDIGADESDGTFYTYVSTPQFDPKGGLFYTPHSVTITCATEGATIHYTTNGVDPTETDPVIESGSSVLIDKTTNLRAKAWKTGWTESFVKTAQYTVTGTAATPVIELPGGHYDSAQYAAITCATAGATIRYTLDGSDPHSSAALTYSGPVRIDHDLTLKACGTLYQWLPSDTASADYQFRQPRVLRVDADAQAVSQDGSSWDNAFASVYDALEGAVRGDEVWVADGTYVGCLTLYPGIGLYGGFSGSESTRDQRDYKKNVTVLDGNAIGNVILATPESAANAVIDGFTIQNGKGPGGAGIRCDNSSPTIRNNIIKNCAADKYLDAYGGGIYCIGSSSLISGNSVLGCSAGSGGGIYCSGGLPTIDENSIRGCKSSSDGGGICLANGSSAVVTNNVIVEGSAGNMGGGAICCLHSSATISGNRMMGNVASYGGAVACYESSVRIANNCVYANMGSAFRIDGSSTSLVNNTIVKNSGTAVGCSFASPDLANNIIAFNSRGIVADENQPAPVLNNNCIFGNINNDFTNMSNPVGANGNISIDPRLAKAELGDVHVQPDSPCVDAGDDGVVEITDLDMDQQARVQGDHVDIGADESDGTVWDYQPLTIRVSPEGDDRNDGSSWSQAKRSVQAAIDSAFPAGGEVWVKAGTYPETLLLKPCVYLYGGFKGGEIAKNQRDWNANVTTLDGQGSARVITTLAGCFVNTIDGFTVTNGSSDIGGGILAVAPIAIKNNTVTHNQANSAGGISCSTTSVVSDCTISNNTASYNGGMSVSTGTVTRCRIFGNTGTQWCGGISVGTGTTIRDCLITDNIGGGVSGSGTFSAYNCTIARNSSGTGIYCSYPAAVVNCISAYNSIGVDLSGTLISNCVYGNTTSDYRYPNQDQTGKNGNISSDPLFADQAHGDYHLLPGSPCIDTGSTTDALSKDLDYNHRPIDGNADGLAAADMGCFEYPRHYAMLAQAKALPDGSPVSVGSVIVTAIFSDRFYVETPDRTCGIGVLGSVQSTGAYVTIEGALTTVDGERLIVPAVTGQNASATVPAPWFMNPNSIGGGPLALQTGVSDWRYVTKPDDQGDPVSARELVSYGGANNIGLLIKAVGRVNYVDDNCFYLDGGGAFDDGRPDVKGIRVLRVPTISYTPQTGDLITVVGISSCTAMEGVDGRFARMIRPVSVAP